MYMGMKLRAVYWGDGKYYPAVAADISTSTKWAHAPVKVVFIDWDGYWEWKAKADLLPQLWTIEEEEW